MSYTDSDYDQAKEILLDHKGKGNEISSRELNEELGLDNVGSFPTTRQLIRDIMFEDGIPVIGGGNGYYVAETEEEVAEYVETLESRILNTGERRAAVKRAAKKWDDVKEDDDYDVL